MILELFKADGTLYKNAAFIGYEYITYTNYIKDKTPINVSRAPGTHQIFWRFK